MSDETVEPVVPVEPVAPASPEVPPVGVTPTSPAPVGEVVPAPVDAPKVMYMGKLVVERFDLVKEDGRHCRLEDGSTVFVPLEILGETVSK